MIIIISNNTTNDKANHNNNNNNNDNDNSMSTLKCEYTYVASSLVLKHTYTIVDVYDAIMFAIYVDGSFSEKYRCCLAPSSLEGAAVVCDLV